MAIYNLGSINIDRFYAVPHFPQPGETISAEDYGEGLGGKGANMSVAIARGAARAVHIGAVGPEGRWATDRLLEYGVDTRHIVQRECATGHANITVDGAGENIIVIFPGANNTLDADQISGALSEANVGDWLLMQNETNAQMEAATLARTLGLKVAYAAAPFSAEAVAPLLPFLDLLMMNAVEAKQLEAATGRSISALGVPDVVITKGADGAEWISGNGRRSIPAIPAQVVDSTGAGDTFSGYLLAGLDRGMPMEQALRLATQAAALMVARKGTADVIPDLRDIQEAGRARP